LVSLSHAYNDSQRLTSVTEGGTTLGQYTYNALGRRTKKVAGGTTTLYIYNQNGLLIAEYDGDGTWQKDYLYLNGQPLAMIVANTPENVYYYHNDHLGTTQMMTDLTGTVVWAATYEPFGKATITIQQITNNLRFPGQYYDAETGLCYNWNRDYNQQLGRYIESDPIGLWDGINLWLYAQNNPVSWIDPLGLAVLNPYNYPISRQVQQSLERFNNHIGQNKDIVITGGNRLPNSNLGVGGGSTHVQDIAADIYVPGQSNLQTANQAAESGLFGGIGWYEEGYIGPYGEGPHVHVDLRTGTARWGFSRTGREYHGYFPKYGGDCK
jgi:RHS repeat-associated protein